MLDNVKRNSFVITVEALLFVRAWNQKTTRRGKENRSKLNYMCCYVMKSHNTVKVYTVLEMIVLYFKFDRIKLKYLSHGHSIALYSLHSYILLA